MAAADWGTDADALADIKDRLEVISEELADLGRATLRRALHDEEGRQEASRSERKLAAARRAVLKAVSTLGTLDVDD